MGIGISCRIDTRSDTWASNLPVDDAGKCRKMHVVRAYDFMTVCVFKFLVFS